MIKATITMIIEGKTYSELTDAVDALLGEMKVDAAGTIPYDGLLKIVDDETQAVSTAHIVASSFTQYIQ